MAIRKAKKQPTDNRPRCDRCHYYDREDATAGEGLCRRYPPNGDVWHAVWAADWCGEYLTAGMSDDEHLSIPDAGKRYFGLSVNGSYLAAKRGDLPWVWIGSRKRVPISAMSHLTPRE